MLDRDRPQGRQRLRLVQHPLGQVRVESDPLPFARAERTGLVPDRIRDPEPANVMDNPGPESRQDSGPSNGVRSWLDLDRVRWASGVIG